VRSSKVVWGEWTDAPVVVDPAAAPLVVDEAAA
jgi:hypothetical protein